MAKSILVALMMLTTLNSENLTQVQIGKINTPVVKMQNNSLIIEEYNKVSFTEAILFEGQKVTEIIIKTYAKMPINTIHKEQFIAISSTMSDQMGQSVLFSPQFATYLKSTELLTEKPNKNEDITLELIFDKKGIKGRVYSKTKNITHVIPYSKMFNIKLK
ncbi:MAG: hypothetical protein KU38_08800 [Sulfurovum sp. FS08-3]|nr:MAG: hypothetical protein KU38_08800 [Sulfurovum sp. FS08-3]